MGCIISIYEVHQLGRESRSKNDKNSNDLCDPDLGSFDLETCTAQAFDEMNVWFKFN